MLVHTTEDPAAPSGAGCAGATPIFGGSGAANKRAMKSLVDIVPNPDHRRSPILRLTPRGADVLARINAAQAVWSNEMTEGLRLPDLEAAVRAIREVTERLKGAV